MNLFDNIISNSKIFIIIIIFFKNLFKSFKLKNLNLLNVIFFLIKFFKVIEIKFKKY